MVSDQRRITAEHEAAHAIVYLAYGFQVKRISVPDAATYRRPAPIEAHDEVEVLMAGVVIEDRHAPRDLRQRVADLVDYLDLEGDEGADSLGDLYVAWRIDPEYIEHGYRNAARILGEHEDSHRHLTDALHEREVLRWADIKAIVPEMIL